VLFQEKMSHGLITKKEGLFLLCHRQTKESSNNKKTSPVIFHAKVIPTNDNVYCNENIGI